MRRHARYCVGLLGILMLTAPAWSSGSKHTDSMTLDVDQATTIGNTQLMPGHYTLKADESQNQLDVIHEGKTIATIPGQWVSLDQKADSSEVESENNRITEVKFQGRKEALKIS